MTDNNVLISGGTSGIGFETAKAIATTGAHVYIVGRNEDKAQAAVEHISRETGNTNIRYFLADFASQKSVRELARQVHHQLSHLDVLVNNAGGVFPEFARNADGLEMTIAINHFAPFLLTNLLLDLLQKSASGRIVNVSSGSHYSAQIDFESFTQPKGYFIMKAYAQSKLANIFFTQELAERLKDTRVTANCLHPGFVRTHIGNKGTNWYTGLIWSLGTRLGGITPEEGARTSVYLATSDEVNNVSGKYFDKCRQKKPAPITQNKTLQKKLWEISEHLCPIIEATA